MKKWIAILGGAIALLGLILAALWFYQSIYLINQEIPVIRFKGPAYQQLKLGEPYQEAGAIGIVGEKEYPIKATGFVDSNKTGIYEIKYYQKNKKGKKEQTKIRYVKVIDADKPVITLKGKKEVILYIGDQYKEEGYEAKDNYDGDLSKKVIVTNPVNTKKAGTYSIIYEVVDSSNNKTKAERKITVKEKPTYEVGVSVLMYHFFYDKSKKETGADGNWIEIRNFEAQVKYLKDNQFYFPTWQEVEQYLDGKLVLPDKSVVITADDGNESFFRLAYPILKKYQVPATSFLVTSWTNPRKMSQYQDLVSLQSHSHNMHQGGCGTGHGGIFQCIDYNKGKEDLLTSKNLLNRSDAFCYPFGDYNAHEVQLLKDTGYRMAFTTEYGRIYPNMNKYRLPRIRMSASTSLSSFASMVSP